MPSLLHPWTRPGRLGRSLAFLGAGMPWGIVSFTLTVTATATAFGLLFTFFLALPGLWVMWGLSRALGAIERSRVAALTGERVPDGVPPLTRPTRLGRLGERFRSGPRWKELAHHVLAFPIGTISMSLALAAWGGSLALLGLPLYVRAFPGHQARFHLFDLGPGVGAWAAAAVGLVGVVLVAPWVTIGLAQGQAGIARWFLGRSKDAVLAEQVVELEGRRSAAVDSAEAERRRIERDLHDGAQQRLVALAANLGAARERLESDPEGGRAMVAAAHEESKAALKEIRDLVRGIHPVILEDRGLDAALSAVVARSPIPVALDVRVQPRPSAAVESAAYFVVNEALTNVARHAEATRAYVSIARAGNRLVVEVRDDGKGGADASRGTGLQGLRERVAGLGGDLHVISPLGGPTTISVELPCGS